MRIKVTTSYPWSGIDGDWSIIETVNGLSESELREIAFEYALDLIFDRGVEWNYEIIKEE